MPTKADCTCPNPDQGIFDEHCPDHVVIVMREPTENVLAAQRAYDAGHCICNYGVKHTHCPKHGPTPTTQESGPENPSPVS